jgi:osmoprotectant transport system permease protein
MKGRDLAAAAIIALCLAFIASSTAMELFLRLLFPAEPDVLYRLVSQRELLMQHLFLSLGASAAAGLIGFAGGAIAHFKGGSLKDLVLASGALAQTVPPPAVLALAVPILGFGTKPVLLALVLYGILPVLHGTVAGLASAPSEAVEAARGLGMSRVARFLKVELPLALPAVAAGLRSSVVINVGTAAIGAAMGAGGLGRPIMAGLVQFKTSYVIQGAVAAACLALCLDWLLARLERALSRD